MQYFKTSSFGIDFSVTWVRSTGFYSQNRSAFGIVGSSGGLQGAFHLRSEVSETTSISSSDKHSSIPELTRAEELAIKRASATFAPIGQGGGSEQGRMTQNAEDFVASWRPSDDLMMSLERATGTRQTADWDGDGIEVSQPHLNPPVEMIPSHVRGSTPDSVASSGNFRLSNARGEHRDLTVRNLQENAEHRTDNPSWNMAKSTRAFVQHITSEDNRPSTSAEDVNIEMRRNRLDETDGPTRYNTKETDEKNRLFLPKCVLLLVVVMIALAGIVALIVFFKQDKPDGRRGNIIPDPITEVECPSRSFNLGDNLNFTCTFDVQHSYRKILLEAETIHVIPKNLAFTGNSLDYNVTNYTDTNRRTFYFTGNGLTARCSSEGSYDVIFFNKNRENIHIANVIFSIKASSLTSTFKQRQLTGESCLRSEFDATCELKNDCNNYHTTMFRRKNGREESLNRYMTCDRNYTDTDGYMVSCSATIPDDLVENYVSLGCKMVTALQNDKPHKLEKTFELPSCGVKPSCHTYIPNNPRPFNCSEKGRDIERLNNATCDFPVLTSCFKPGRQIFKGIYKDHLNNLTCSEEHTVPVCRLSWCRDYNYVVKNEIPGVALCRQTYDEPYVTPPTEAPTIDN
ncbi:uncharacterized protein LOC123553791 isoform X2 [Mercenaria mercenaria]|uniref:uncharacterized protein LOC123553791 isoform X2 n=1 Tax=Mercenaria mercenaria TaxID=6596 RepID=UPI00234F2DC5|nr:uncharacterized protein LOC123553791 isoform X2 [Mercenaria mercenaria]